MDNFFRSPFSDVNCILSRCSQILLGLLAAANSESAPKSLDKMDLCSDFDHFSLLAAASNKKVFDCSDSEYIRKDLVDRPS